jgi:hypothetical protein
MAQREEKPQDSGKPPVKVEKKSIEQLLREREAKRIVKK